MAETTPVGGIINSLPLDIMFGAPLKAAIDAHTHACVAFKDFIEDVGFIDVSGIKQTRMVRFAYKRKNVLPDGSVEKGSDKGIDELAIDIPFLAIIPLPAFGVDKLTIDFDLKVDTAETETSGTVAGAKAGGSVGWGPWKASISGSVTHKKEQTRSTDTSARYTVHLEASRQTPTEGLMRVIDCITDAATKPIPKDDAPKLPADSSTSGGGGTGGNP